DDVGVGRIDVDVRAGRLGIDVEDALPGLAAVSGLVEAALLARAPLTAEDGHIDNVGVFRIDDDPSDLVRRGEPDAGEVLAAVGRLVDAVADRRVVARVLLAGADVDDVGV